MRAHLNSYRRRRRVAETNNVKSHATYSWCTMGIQPTHGHMDTMSVGASADQGLVVCDTRGFRSPMAWGLGCSALLHVLVVLLFTFGLTRPLQAPPPADVPVSVELVQLDQKGTSPQPRKEGSGRQQETPVSDAAQPRPGTGTPLQAIKPEPQKRETDLSKNELPRHHQPAEGKTPRKRPPLHDEIDALFRVVENAHRQTVAPPTQSRTGGPALAKPDGAEPKPGHGLDGSSGVKDFIRAQIERHWQFELSNLGATGPMISLHLKLSADGRVLEAEVADDPRYSADVRYRAIATSARNAALLSSPLHLPPGTYDAVKDITVKLDPREVLQ